MFESHFQSFDAARDPASGGPRLALLRAELKRRGLDGFIVPRADEHQNEYVPPCAERLAWLTGFGGSAGTTIVLPAKAAIFVDGRYTLAVRDEVDVKLFAPLNSGETTPDAWLEANAGKGARIGFDPWLHTPAQVARYEAALKAAGGELVAVADNPLDAVWADRPAPPCGAVTPHPPRLAGESAARKIARVRKALARVDGLLVSDPHAIAWLFNLRGSDVAHTPIALAFAYVPADGAPTLYIDPVKLSGAAVAALARVARVAPPAALISDLEALGASGKRVRFDSATAPARLTRALEAAGGAADLGADPIGLMKARKNETELRGARAAHLRDAVAMARFLAWFAGASRSGITEIDAARALESFRRETGALKDISFPTIAGAGPNGAIVHYRVDERSNRKIGQGLFLLDSGAQYVDGTTDITRTLSVGKPTAEMRDRFTRVLKGHIGIATAVFPVGVNGGQIDAFARRALWEAGLDYDHGTGHGVGAYLSVHEGPQRISKVGSVPLEPGMILSNEPGYYKAGHWGIRIENLIVVEPRAIKGAERKMLGFETITLAPIDRALVDIRLLSRDEIAWLDAYHARVRKSLSPHLDAATRKWLAAATRSLGKG
jgi:Xaa-Pro aminopeptidase